MWLVFLGKIIQSTVMVLLKDEIEMLKSNSC